MNLLDLTRSEHRRRLTVGACTLLGLVVADVVVRRAQPTLRAYDMGASDNEYFDRKPAQIRQMSPVPDIILMGSSRARYAFVPDDFEREACSRAYNLGINGAQTVEWLVMARQLFGERKPRLVVLGVNAGEFRADYRPVVGARFLFGPTDLIESFVMEGASPDLLAPFFRHVIGPSWATYERRHHIKLWGQEQLGHLAPAGARAARRLRERVAVLHPPEDRRGVPKGYGHPWTHGWRMNEFGRSEGAAVTSVPSFSEAAGTFARFDQFLGWLQNHDIPVVVAYVPNSPKTERRWAAIEPRMILTIDFLCRARGVSFLRCDQADLPRENKDYLDEVHVGWPLARRISQRVARHVKMLGELGSRAPSAIAMLR